MKKLLLFVLFAAGAAAQQRTPVSSLQPDCMVTFNFTAASSGAQASGTVTAGSTGTTSVIDNRTDAACLDWMVTYSTTTGISALSLLFQTATNANGVPGTWSAYGGTLSTGINPNTAATAPWAVTNATGNKYPFLRMNLTAITGAGTISGNLYGWKRRPEFVTVSAGSTCPASSPCAVDGPTAAGAAPTFPPVMIAGQDGAPGVIRTILTDSSGRVIDVGAAASGAAKAGNPVQTGGVFNTTQPTVTTGQAVENQATPRGAQIVAPGVEGFPVTIGGNSAVLSGQQSVTSSAVALASNTAKTVCVKALVSNVINVFIGPAGITTSTGFLLAPGEGACMPLTNTNLVAVIASTTGASVSWIATN